MSHANESRDRVRILPWVLLALWICVIWGHSLMPGHDSSAESGWVLGLVQKAGAWLFTRDIPQVQQLLDAHPGILRVFADTQLLHHYIRKAGHFSEYFVLGILTWNAVRSAFRHPLPTMAVIGALWVGVPNIDETIQRFVPGRAGMTQDVLLDMSGFGCAFVLCITFFAIASLFRGIADLVSGGQRS